MTKKDYELIAKALGATCPEGCCEAYEQWLRDVSSLADALMRENARFIRLKFYRATGAIKEG